MPKIIVQSALLIGVKELAIIMNKSTRTVERYFSCPILRLRLPPVIPSCKENDKPTWFLPTVLKFWGGESWDSSVQIQVVVNSESILNKSLSPKILSLGEGLAMLREGK